MKHLRIIAKNIALKRCLTLAHSNLRLYICITLTEKVSAKTKGLVVQLVRMPPCHGGGRGFESRPDRSLKTAVNKSKRLSS